MRRKSRPEDYPTKTCKICGIEKERVDFHDHKNSVGGIRNICIDCESVKRRAKYAENRIIAMQSFLPEKLADNELQNEEYKSEKYTHIFKICNKCKTPKDTGMFNRTNNPKSRSKVVPYCKICEYELRRANRAKPSGRFKSMICDAKRWKHDWKLTYEEFLTFWQKPCNYCGAEIKTCSLDRVNASLGYSIENVVPCCHDCNQFKMDQTLEQFREHVLALYLNLDGIRNIEPFDFASTEVIHCHICGKLNSEHLKACRENSKRIFHKTEYEKAEWKKKVVNDNAKTPRGRYSTYKKKAKFKEIGWSLSQDNFYKMWNKPCSYCLRQINGVGVDRINSSIGYQPNNITPCCGRCNAGKMNHSISKFADLIEKIHLRFSVQLD